MHPVNIYAISRIHDEYSFNVIEKHESRKHDKHLVKHHEIDSLRLLADELTRCGVTTREMDGFYFGFDIPQIGKEFDLLKITDKQCLNIELKSQKVPEDQIRSQLIKNRHYLGHLGKRLGLYTVVTDTLTCYRLSLNEELVQIDPHEIAAAVKKADEEYVTSIDKLFRASEYLISPLNTPDKFIQGEYFLTQAQDQVRKNVLREVDNAIGNVYYHITGRPGTGKTLLLYDIAKALSQNGSTLIVHCGRLYDGQRKIRREINNLNIVSSSGISSPDFDMSRYIFILVDESHRMSLKQFEKICDSVENNDQICIFSSDPEQILSTAEKRRNIVGKIRELTPESEFELSERIRMNKELQAFIRNIRNLENRPKEHILYENVSLNYANDIREAISLISYYRNMEYVFINYTRPDDKCTRSDAIAGSSRSESDASVQDGSTGFSPDGSTRSTSRGSALSDPDGSTGPMPDGSTRSTSCRSAVFDPDGSTGAAPGRYSGAASVRTENPYAELEEDFDTHHVIGQEYDKVVMLMDRSFYYDEDGVLNGVPYPDPDYIYPNLFYQGVTRVREKLALIVVDAPELFRSMLTVLDQR